MFVSTNRQQDPSPAAAEAQMLRRYIGYQVSVTGELGYEFFENGERICSVSCQSCLSAPVMIYGNGVRWRSDFDGDSTIIPGLTRTIQNDLDGNPLYRLVYKSPGLYEVGGSMTVSFGPRHFIFFSENRVLAVIYRIGNKADYPPMPRDGYNKYYFESEPYFEVTAEDGLDPDLLLLVLAFPMLKFAW